MLIQTENLSRTYVMGGNQVHALQPVDLSVQRGEFLAVTGPSGAGKSTLMHILGCLERPTEGKYYLDGHDVSSMSDAELAGVRGRQIGFVFQSYNLAHHLTVQENVMLAPFYIRDHSREATERCLQAIEMVGLADRIRHRPSQLSGGEMQRAAIARALANDPLLLLADEPTGNLDTATGSEIMNLIHSLHESGRTIVMVTHDEALARDTQRQIKMVDGRIEGDGPQ
jgi:putative ABC transport system ATP-binding protein